MSNTPAAQLARLKVTHQEWLIGREPDLGTFAAQHREDERYLEAATIGELGGLLLEADNGARAAAVRAGTLASWARRRTST